MQKKYFQKNVLLPSLAVGLLVGCLCFGIGYTLGVRQTTPVIAGEWFLKSYDANGAPVGKSAVVTISQDSSQLISLLEGTRTYEGYMDKNKIHLSAPCDKTQGCDTTEVHGVISRDVLSGTWKDVRNAEVVNTGRWIAEKSRDALDQCATMESSIPDINGNWAFKIFNEAGLAEERTIVIFQEGQKITIREQEEEFKGYVNNKELFAYSIVSDKNEIVEIEGVISGKVIQGEWKVQVGETVVESGSWEAEKK